MSVIVPPVPSNFEVQQGNGQVFLSWSIVAGSTNYVLQRSPDGVVFTTLVSPTLNNYLDTTVTINTAYFYQVAAQNAQGISNYTLPQSVVPTTTGSLSLEQLRMMSKQRADLVNSTFVTDTEWNTYINQSAFELYDLLTTLYEDYNVAQPAIFLSAGLSQQYPLPDGQLTFMNPDGSPYIAPPFYKLLGIDCGLATLSDAWVTLHKFDFISRNRYVFPNITSTYLGVFNLRYRVMGNQIYFIPTPSGNQFFRLWYVPRMRELLKDTDILDGVSGWTEYVIIDAAIKAMQKQEFDVTVLALQKQTIIDRINSTAMNRDAGQPDTISDTRSWGERWGGGYGSPNGDGSFGGY